MSISAMVNTFNEEKNILGCLQALQWVDELVVVDSGSTDKTVSLARKLAHLVVSVSPGNFSELRNTGLKHLTCEWVLFIDADERVTVELREEILACLGKDPEQNAFELRRNNMFRGHAWGDGNDYVLRLFRNNCGYQFSGKVHEKLNIDEPTGRLSAPLLHYSYENLEQYLRKLNLYTTLASEMMHEQGRRVTFWHLFFRPGWEFLNRYFVRSGYKYGVWGLIFSYMSSMYVFVKFAKLWLLLDRNKLRTGRSQ